MLIWRPDWSTDWLPNKGNVIFTVFMIAITLWAQSAGAITLGATTATNLMTTIPYQGYLTDENDNPLNGPHALTFKLYTQASGGAAIWAEQWNGENLIQIEDGLFSVQLGTLNAIHQDVIASDDQLYLGIAIDADAEMTPRLQLGSGVPAAKQTATYHLSDSTYRNLTTADRRAVLSVFSLNDVPAGDMTIYCSFIALTNAPTNINGSVVLQTEPGGVVTFTPSHIFSDHRDNYVIHGQVANFVGGDMEIKLLFTGESGEISVKFGNANNDSRFGRKCTVTAGL